MTWIPTGASPRRSPRSSTDAAVDDVNGPAMTATRRYSRVTSGPSSPMLQSIAARRLRCRCGPATPDGSVSSAASRSESWSSSWCGDSTRRAAAASSMASGMPSRRRHSSAISAAFVGVTSTSGRTTCARSRNSCGRRGPEHASASGVRPRRAPASGSSHTTRSRGTPSATRLVARIVRPGVRSPQVRERRRGAPQVLHRVQDEDRGPVAQRLRERLGQRPAGLVGDADRARDRRQHHRAVADGVERHAGDPPVALGEGPDRQLGGQPALPHPADADQRDEPVLAVEREVVDRREVRVPAHQRRVRDRPARRPATRGRGVAGPGGWRAAWRGRGGGRRWAQPSGASRSRAYAGNRNRWLRARMPPWASRATVAGRRGLARREPRQQQVRGGGHRVGAARRQPHDRRAAELREPQHGARVGRDAAPNDPAAQGVEGHEERVRGVGARAAGGEQDVGPPPVRATRRGPPERRDDRVDLVVDVLEAA